MATLVSHIYDLLRRRPLVGWGVFLVSTMLAACAVLTLRYKEDISDFLPMDEANRTALSVYRNVSGAGNIYAILSARDTSTVDLGALTDAVDTLVEGIREADTLALVEEMTAQVDVDRMMDVADMLYADIPLFLTESDHARIDSLLAIPGYVAGKLAEDKEMLLFPSSQMLVQGIARDPLGLFTPVMERLSSSGMSRAFGTYDGYILSPDGTKAIVIISSASGASESDNNASLLSLLGNAVSRTEAANPAVDVHIIGGPAIAVANAERIRQDSMLAVTLSAILILALLVYAFRSARNILLIAVSVGWGWLFAMAGMSLMYGSVSVIVIGIASVILGIAVNYPLHLIDHLKESAHPRTALREIVSPLLIGNVTTVGAFLCVVPMEAPALHDLGVFSSLLLVGTIFFVLVFLPHAVRTHAGEGDGRTARAPGWINRLAGLSMEDHPWAVRTVILLTVVFACFSLRTEFDTDMRNINYMTDEQKADFDYFNALFNKDMDTETAYLVSTGQDWQTALRQNERVGPVIDSLQQAGVVRRGSSATSFLVSRQVQAGRLLRWQAFLDRHGSILRTELAEASQSEGFSASAFVPFHDILSAVYTTHDLGHFSELASTVFRGSISEDTAAGRKSVVQTLELLPGDMERLHRAVEGVDGYDGMVFDVRSMNEAMAGTLSDNFNYIGLACGCIVFFFLWFSFGNAELAVASFVPMAVSWLWILGIMAILGIRFNIVNIILATFIFGQGDDYTIFMTEGLSYEYAYRRKLLASYKSSIVVSALIMFIGMGTLVFARHPALRSLGEVIVVGMSSVVLMAYLFPPLIFNRLVRSGGRLRLRPVTIGRMLRTACCAVMLHVVLCLLCVAGAIRFGWFLPTPERRRGYRRRVAAMLRFVLSHLPGISLTLCEGNVALQGGDTVAVLCYRHRSAWDAIFLMACSPDIVMVSDEVQSVHPMLRHIMEWGGYACSQADAMSALQIHQGDACCRCLLAADSLAVARALASSLRCAVRTLHVIGSDYVLPDGLSVVCAGPLYIGVGTPVLRLPADEASFDDFVLRCSAEETELRRRVLGLRHLLPVVFDRYRYKGRAVEMRARRALQRLVSDPSLLQHAGTSSIRMALASEDDQGEAALLLALMYPEAEICVTPASQDAHDMILGCTDGVIGNVTVLAPAQ